MWFVSEAKPCVVGLMPTNRNTLCAGRFISTKFNLKRNEIFNWASWSNNNNGSIKAIG